ncbi:septum site-determining protein MinC [Robertmurraya yapensis]|uniref:Septum site-determining protein MinC n=2 Tax=Bacillaceae TaxID=186817 RepID=A0ACC6SBA3_9BACI|nr:septum site-determining protein MinC [Bacillus yapensis]RTR35457.1 septum site-determining protein MinC [Bacillus yapensis]TKS97966.1 septum site-determining protein MinC [Bacillus yapensis]
MKKTQNVLIKGTKDGLTLHLDDQCSYEKLKKELNEKLTENQRVNEEHPLITVSVKIGNRFLTDAQQEEIKTIIRQKKNLVVGSIDSNVMAKSDAEQMMRENEIVSVARIIRSGQVLEVPGDLLLIGDVNPGGKVVAGGNVFIMGALRGIAHAGANGNSNAVISASLMMPTQLRINDAISRSPDFTGDEEKREMECAYIDHTDQIIIDRLQALMHLRPNLTRLEGGF